jgi:hypothetical protein
MLLKVGISAKFSIRPTMLSIHNHLFPAANTGLAHLRGEPHREGS